MKSPGDIDQHRSVFGSLYLPVIVYAIMILGLSSIPDLSPPIQSAFPVDKVIHFLEYAGFCYFVLRLCSHLFRRGPFWLPVVLSGIITATFAVGDELYQHLIPGRYADPYDIMADLSGASVVLMYSSLKHLMRRKPRE